MENFTELLESYLVELFDKHKERNDLHYRLLQEQYKGNYNTFSVDHGSKYAKILITSGGQKAVHCFVEKANGNIHKSATYKAPQKNGVRGNLANEKKPIFCGDFYVKY